MNKHITDEKTGISYTLQGDCYLPDMNRQAEEMFSRLVKQMAEREGVGEKLKTENQMLWVDKMNTIREAATKIVNNDLIYA